MIDNSGLEMLAQSVAEQVFIDTGRKTGFASNIDEPGKRALFTFRVGEPYVYADIPLDELTKAHSWQGIFDRLVEKCLFEATPWVLARKRAMQRQSKFEPEIAPTIDQKGRRHFRMFAETIPVFGIMKG